MPAGTPRRPATRPLLTTYFVIAFGELAFPAHTGIQSEMTRCWNLDSRLRGNDGVGWSPLGVPRKYHFLGNQSERDFVVVQIVVEDAAAAAGA